MPYQARIGSAANVFPLVNKVDIDHFLAQASAADETGEQIGAAVRAMDAQLDQTVAESQVELEDEIQVELLRGEHFGVLEQVAIETAWPNPVNWCLNTAT